MWTKPAGCAPCLNSKRTTGFCADQVIPGARVALFAGSPSKTELATDTPLSGPAGFVLASRVLNHAGLGAQPISKCNTLRCMQPDDVYPTGPTRRDAEASCRQYDRLRPDDFDVTLITIDPADMLHTKYDPLVLLVSDFTRVRKFLDQGKSVAVLLGTEAKELWSPWLVGVDAVGKKHAGANDWRGHYWHKGSTTFGPLLKQQPLAFNDFRKAMGDATVGLDLEWNQDGVITLAGFCTDRFSCIISDPSADNLQTIVTQAQFVVGHNLLGHKSDRDRLLAYGVELPVEKVKDTMLMFHLLFPQLAGHGFLDLWTMCSLYTDYPNWKLCRGDGHCFGPCPLHNPALYNEYDVCACYEAHHQMQLELTLRGVA